MLRLFLLVITILLAVTAAFAELTVVQGTVTLSNGTPCLNMTVTITVDGKTYTVITDRRGHFGKSVPAGQATITVEGVTKTVILSPDDWEKNTVDIAISNDQITQTLFDVDGKVCPNAEVTITYSWENQIVYRQAKADAAGKIVWRDLPPVRAIVWGPRVPAGVLPIGTPVITTPLPAPAPAEKDYMIVFTLPTPPGPMAQITWMVDPPGPNGGITTPAIMSIRYTDRSIRSNGNQYHFIGGTRYSMVVVMQSTPLRYAALNDVYAPYNEGGDVFKRLSLDWQEGMNVPLKIVTADGNPAPTLNGLRATPENVPGLPALFLREFGHLNGGFPRAPAGPGAWMLSLPGPGAYRLEGDLFTGAAAFPFTVTAQQPAVAIKLPPPLITAPGGAEITYLLRNAPGVPGKMTVDPNVPTGALFGAAHSVLIAWYRPSPNKLIWQTPEMTAPRESALRTVFLRLVGPDGKPIAPAANSPEIVLSALVPAPPEGYGGGYFTQGSPPVDIGNYESPAITHLRAYPDGEWRAQVTAWSGSYILTGLGLASWSTKVEIPAAGANEIVVPVNPVKAETGGIADKRRLNINLPLTAEQRQNGADGITVTTDIPGDKALLQKNTLTAPLAAVQFVVDARATTFSLHWLGVGSIKGVAIPKRNTETPIDLPAWTPGTRVTGTVQAGDGTPVAQQYLTVGNDTYPLSCDIQTQTDTAGHFAVNGAEPGPLFIALYYLEKPGGWTITVPPVGPADFTLKAGRRAGVENCETVSLGLAWWVPATGSPCRLAAMGTSAGTFDPIEGDGYLWLFPDRTNVPQLLPYHPANGMQKERELIWKMGKSGREISGPPLGVLLPMDPRTRSKTTITLTGRGLRGGCQVAIANCIGTNCGLLGKVCYQIAPVPPGEYTVSIETGAGILSAPAVVTADGGSVEIAYPPAP